MKNKQGKIYVISLGGSLIIPEAGVDISFLKEFKKVLLSRVRLGDKFILITGGGELCRQYQKALNTLARASSDNLDWMGIYATRFNAQLVRLMFGPLAHRQVIDFPNKKVLFKEKILVAGGWIPGRSTDDDAVRLAKVYGSKIMVNLSNVDHLYTKDPRKFKDAKAIKRISWNDYRKMAGSKWKPGLHLPFDPIASKFAQKEKQQVIIADGQNLKNLSKILNGQEFAGTLIE